MSIPGKSGLLDLEEVNQLEGGDNKRIKYVNPDKKNATKRTVTSILSQQMLPPVTKRKTARYQVINAYRKDPLLASNPTGDDILPYDVIISGTYMVYDPFETDLGKSMKMMKNITRPGIEIKDGKQVATEVVEDILMTNGFIEINMETQYPLYVLMELHPLNKNNRRRDNTKVPVFERTDLSYRSMASLDAFEDMSMEASKEVKDMDLDRVIALAATLNIPTAGRQSGDIRYDLRLFAKNKPLEFYRLRPDSQHMVKINFNDAMEFGFVEYSADKRGYSFTGPLDKKPFFTHTVQEEPVDAVTKALLKPDYKEAYDRILEYLNFWQ